jgi:hypothetical protein
MNSIKQFWALFKFQTTINPFIWFMPLVFGMPLLLPLITGSFSKDYHPGFYSLFTNQNLFFVIIFGSMILAPEKFQLGAANLTSNYFGTEFILTRAIDRPVLYRAKTAVLYVLILALPCIALVNSLKDPDLIVSEYSKLVQQECLSNVPGSALLPPKYKKSPPSLISIPRGNVLTAEWQFGVLLIMAISLQLSILILYPFKYGKIIFWTFYFGILLLPLFDIRSIGKDTPTLNERLFFFFAANQALFWILTSLTFVLGQLWCERRYCRLEQ